MNAAEASPPEARVRWLVAGQFSLAPSGQRFRLDADHFAERLTQGTTAIPVRLTRGDGGAPQTLELSFPKLRSFSLSEMVAAVPALRGLKELSDAFGSADALRRPTAQAGVARLEELWGAGALSEALRAALAPAATGPTSASSSPTAPEAPADLCADPVDALFAKAEARGSPSLAQAGVDAFVRAMGAGNGNVSGEPHNPAGAKAARAMLEGAAFFGAKELLETPDAARLESAWRGLRLLLDQCPNSSGMSIEVLDVEPSRLVEEVLRALPDDSFERPDALFVVDEIDRLELLIELAQLAEDAHLPAVAAVPAGLFSARNAAELGNQLEAKPAGVPEGWNALRSDESARWLCVATNRIALHTEGSGILRRTCFGSACWGVAALLAASYRETGSFARIMGKAGALRGPAVWEPGEGRDAGTAIPTESFLSIRAQTTLAQAGLLGVGSSRNSDALTLSTAPTARAAADTVPLPAQILTGRILRFAQWVRDQLPGTATNEEISALFEQGAEVFLFAGAPQAGRVKAEVVSSPEGKKGVLVTAALRPEYAGAPVQLGFTLPLR